MAEPALAPQDCEALLPQEAEGVRTPATTGRGGGGRLARNGVAAAVLLALAFGVVLALHPSPRGGSGLATQEATLDLSSFQIEAEEKAPLPIQGVFNLQVPDAAAFLKLPNMAQGIAQGIVKALGIQAGSVQVTISVDTKFMAVKVEFKAVSTLTAYASIQLRLIAMPASELTGFISFGLTQEGAKPPAFTVFGLAIKEDQASPEPITASLLLRVANAAVFIKDPKASEGLAAGMAQAVGVLLGNVQVTLTLDVSLAVRVDFKITVSVTLFAALQQRLVALPTVQLTSLLSSGLGLVMVKPPLVTVTTWEVKVGAQNPEPILGTFSLQVTNAASFVQDPKVVEGIAVGIAKAINILPGDVALKLTVVGLVVKIEYKITVTVGLFSALQLRCSSLPPTKLTIFISSGLAEVLPAPPTITVTTFQVVVEPPSPVPVAGSLTLQVSTASTFVKDPKAVEGIANGIAKALGVLPSSVTLTLTLVQTTVKVEFRVAVAVSLFASLQVRVTSLPLPEFTGFITVGLQLVFPTPPVVTVLSVTLVPEKLSSKPLEGSLRITVSNAATFVKDPKAVDGIAAGLAKAIGVLPEAVVLTLTLEVLVVKVSFQITVALSRLASLQLRLTSMALTTITGFVSFGLGLFFPTPPTIVVTVVVIGSGGVKSDTPPALPPPPPPPPPPPADVFGPKEAVCSWEGDPHFSTFDGRRQDELRSGKWWVVRHGVVQIQGLYCGRYNAQRRECQSNAPARTRGLAIAGSFLLGRALVIETAEGHVYWDKKAVDNANGANDFEFSAAVGTATLKLSQLGGVLKVELPNGVKVTVSRNQGSLFWGKHMNVVVTMKALNGQEGNCGNFDGDGGNDSFGGKDFSVSTTEDIFISGTPDSSDSRARVDSRPHFQPPCSPASLEKGRATCKAKLSADASPERIDTCAFDVCTLDDPGMADGAAQQEGLVNQARAGALLDDLNVPPAAHEWVFAGCTGNVVDTKSNSVAKLFGGAQCGAEGVRLNGNGQFVSYDSFVWGGSIAIEITVKYESINSWSRILDFGDGGSINEIHVANSFRSNAGWFEANAPGLAKQTVQAANFWQVGTWQHVVATVSGGFLRLYVNGELKAQRGGVVEPAMVARRNCFSGKSNFAADAFFHGTLGGLRLWQGVAISQGHVSQMFKAWQALAPKAELPPPPPGRRPCRGFLGCLLR